jgi:hypothetical protein
MKGVLEWEDICRGKIIDYVIRDEELRVWDRILATLFPQYPQGPV